MDIQLSEESKNALAEYGRIPIAFEVNRVLDVIPRADGSGGFDLVERQLGVAYVKDYDSIKGEGPTRWMRRFDLSNWGFIAARVDGRRVGGAVIAFNTAGVEMLECRGDLAVLWDLRVLPEFRGRGVGAALFDAAGNWAAARGCRELKIETQNINVPACRFYARQGCVLRTIDPSAYPDLPNEVQMIWCKDLAPAR